MPVVDTVFFLHTYTCSNDFFLFSFFNKLENISARIKNLRKLLHDAKQKEMDETEARIARFTQQQTNLLKLFCEKADHDYQDIIRCVR